MAGRATVALIGWSLGVALACLPASAAQADNHLAGDAAAFCDTISHEELGRVMGAPVSPESSASDPQNCVFNVEESSAQQLGYLVEIARAGDLEELGIIQRLFSGRMVYGVGQTAYWAEGGMALWFLHGESAYFVQLMLFEGSDNEALLRASAGAGLLVDELERRSGSPIAGTRPVQHAALEACKAPPEWPGEKGQIGEWRFRHLCLDDLESFDIAALDTASQSVSLTFACWDGQMSGVVHLAPTAPDIPDGLVEISASSGGAPLRTSGELQDVYGDRTMEIDDDEFFRGLASAMVEAGGEAFPINLRSEGGDLIELRFPLEGFPEAAEPLRSFCGW